MLAPTGTIGFMMDCDTTGIEPDLALVKYKKLVGGGVIKIVNNTVPQALIRWNSQRKAIAIFSSGSVLAQRLLFSSTAAGDLTKFISAYFDTTFGAKRETESYLRIAEALHVSPEAIIFFSDVAGELDAAQAAGMQTRLCQRPDNTIQPAPNHQTIYSFDEMFP